MFRVQCTAIIFPARRCVPWKNSSRRRRGGFGPPSIDRRRGERCFLSPRLVVRKYYSSEKKKSPAPSSKDSKLLLLTAPIFCKAKGSLNSPRSPFIPILSQFSRIIFFCDRKESLKGKREKETFFLRSLGKDNENISVNQERGAVERLVRAYEALATAAIVPTWKRSLHLVCFLSPPPPSLPLLLARHRDTLGSCPPFPLFIITFLLFLHDSLLRAELTTREAARYISEIIRLLGSYAFTLIHPLARSFSRPPLSRVPKATATHPKSFAPFRQPTKNRSSSRFSRAANPPASPRFPLRNPFLHLCTDLLSTNA